MFSVIRIAAGGSQPIWPVTARKAPCLHTDITDICLSLADCPLNALEHGPEMAASTPHTHTHTHTACYKPNSRMKRKRTCTNIPTAHYIHDCLLQTPVQTHKREPLPSRALWCWSSRFAISCRPTDSSWSRVWLRSGRARPVQPSDQPS